jgi:hypothetical protein
MTLATNLFRQLQALLPADPLQSGNVSTTHTDGTATVALLGGGTLRVRNPHGIAQGQRVFVQGGSIQGAAPALPTFTIDV